MSSRTLRLTTAVAAAALGAATLLGAAARRRRPAASATAAGSQTLQDIQLLSINDFHGNLEPPTGSSGTVTRLQRRRDDHAADRAAASSTWRPTSPRPARGTTTR